MVNYEKGIPKIVFVIDGLGIGGAESLMIPILESINREKFDVRVCVLQSKDGNPLADEIRALGVMVDLLNIKRLRDLSAIIRLRKYLKDTQASLVHTQLEFSNILGNISAKLLNLPSVCTIHVLPPTKMNFKQRIHQWVEWLVLRFFCDRVITVSEETRLNYIEKSGISSKKLVTIYNGIDLTRFQRIEPDLERVSVCEEFDIPLDSTLLITVAVLRPQKGIEYMLRAFPAVLSAYPDTYYLIVGDGPQRESLMTEADNLGVTEHVIFVGTRKDIPRLLCACDVFVLPTLTEALPTVLAEAMASRLPIIASAVGGVPEMVKDNGNGKLVSPTKPAELSEACNVLLGNSDERDAMKNLGWQIVNQKFDIKKQVLKLENLYLEQINSYEK